MPGMNAPETIRHLEANRVFRKIPKIIYSAAKEQANDGLQGVVSYIKKGATCSAVNKNVQQMLSYANLLNDLDERSDN